MGVVPLAGATRQTETAGDRMSETDVFIAIQLAASRIGARLFRNNVGQLQDARTGRHVRFGVCNPGGSDLIGWTPVVVTSAMVGQTLAVFTAVETKQGERQATPAQARFLDAVQQSGGIATIARSWEDVTAAIARRA